MLWENNSTIVVMLTKLREMGRVSRGPRGERRGAGPGAGLTTAATSPTGEMSPVLAGRALRPLPVLRGGSDGGIQHASVHPAGVQGHRRQGEFGVGVLGRTRTRARPYRLLTVLLVVRRGLP